MSTLRDKLKATVFLDENMLKFLRDKNGKFEKDKIIDISGTSYQIDLVDLPYNNVGEFRYLMVMVNVSNNHVFYACLGDKTSKTTTDALRSIMQRNRLENQIKTIQSDNGGEFKGEFAQFLAQKGIKQLFMNIYNKNTMGIVERMISTITKPLYEYMSTNTLKQKMTKKGATDYNKDWPSLVRRIVSVINGYYDSKYRNNKFTLNDLLQQKVKLDSKILPLNSKVYLRVKKPVNIVNGEKMFGTFRHGDQHFNETEHTITNYLIKSGRPIRYYIDGDLKLSYLLKDLLEK